MKTKQELLKELQQVHQQVSRAVDETTDIWSIQQALPTYQIVNNQLALLNAQLVVLDATICQLKEAGEQDA
jgi:hypothetical protein